MWAIVSENNFKEIALFFLICVAVAGIYGAYTTHKVKLFFVQSIPALIGIVLILLNK
ncbi:DUF1304 family protein [Lutibacter sp.]